MCNSLNEINSDFVKLYHVRFPYSTINMNAIGSTSRNILKSHKAINVGGTVQCVVTYHSSLNAIYPSIFPSIQYCVGACIQYCVC